MPTLTTDPPIPVEQLIHVGEGAQLVDDRDGKHRLYIVGVSVLRPDPRRSWQPDHTLWVGWSRWGAMGRAHTLSVWVTSPWLYDAFSAAAEKRQEKLAKGYRPLTSRPELWSLSRLIEQAQRLRLPTQPERDRPSDRPIRLMTPFHVRYAADDEVPV